MSSTVIGTIVVTLMTVVGGIIVALIAKSSNRQTTAVAFAAGLNDRLETVEKKLEEVESQLTKSQRALTAAIRFIDRLVDWGRGGGGKDKMPTPPKSIHEYLDTDMWGIDDAAHEADA